jgi:hypothetical protein
MSLRLGQIRHCIIFFITQAIRVFYPYHVKYWIPGIFWKLAAKEKVLHPNDDVNKSQSSNDTFSYSHAYCCVKF